jgi:hypothetical protein
MYISHPANHGSSCLCRNNYNFKNSFKILDEKKYQNLPTPTVCLKANTALAISLLSSEPNQAE